MNGTEATNKTANTTQKSASLDDTISQVFDEIHESSFSTSNHTDEADPTDQGFIGKHLKKLAQIEEQKKKKQEEERRAAEIEKYGGLIGEKEASQIVSGSVIAQKPRGIMARAKAKIDKELKDQQAIQIGESIADPNFAVQIEDIVK